MIDYPVGACGLPSYADNINKMKQTQIPVIPKQIRDVLDMTLILINIMNLQ